MKDENVNITLNKGYNNYKNSIFNRTELENDIFIDLSDIFMNPKKLGNVKYRKIRKSIKDRYCAIEDLQETISDLLLGVNVMSDVKSQQVFKLINKYEAWIKDMEQDIQGYTSILETYLAEDF